MFYPAPQDEYPPLSSSYTIVSLCQFDGELAATSTSSVMAYFTGSKFSQLEPFWGDPATSGDLSKNNI